MIGRLNIQKWFREPSLPKEWYDDLQIELRKSASEPGKIHILQLFNALVVRHYFAMAKKDRNIALFKDLGLTDAQIEMVLPNEEDEDDEDESSPSGSPPSSFHLSNREMRPDIANNKPPLPANALFSKAASSGRWNDIQGHVKSDGGMFEIMRKKRMMMALKKKASKQIDVDILGAAEDNTITIQLSPQRQVVLDVKEEIEDFESAMLRMAQEILAADTEGKASSPRLPARGTPVR